ncbi:MAG TPA: hypothetical protein VK400_17215, partial [Pyrinomonadaceae bacterium]|nr:hypothetical protein [Pyrinomonadaceae bacterium]
TGKAAEGEDLKGESPLREDVVGDNVKAETPVTAAAEENHDQAIAKPTAKLVAQDEPEKNSPPPPLPRTETKLKSAASLRRSGRAPVQKKTVEVVWDEPESAPNVWFLVVAFVLVLFAVGVLLAMLYIR